MRIGIIGAGGGVVAVGGTHVRVVPGEMRAPNELELPASAFANGAGNPAARAFMDFLLGAEAQQIARRYGYASE